VGEVIELKGMPPEIGRHPLRTLNDVGEEIARVYRAFARGKIATKDANAAVFQLTSLARVLEVVRIEHQVELINDRADELGLGRERA
jgi:hypothetical protein